MTGKKFYFPLSQEDLERKYLKLLKVIASSKEHDDFLPDRMVLEDNAVYVEGDVYVDLWRDELMLFSLKLRVDTLDYYILIPSTAYVYTEDSSYVECSTW